MTLSYKLLFINNERINIKRHETEVANNKGILKPSLILVENRR
jgi:hypothetical protein